VQGVPDSLEQKTYPEVQEKPLRKRGDTLSMDPVYGSEISAVHQSASFFPKQEPKRAISLLDQMALVSIAKKRSLQIEIPRALRASKDAGGFLESTCRGQSLSNQLKIVHLTDKFRASLEWFHDEEDEEDDEQEQEHEGTRLDDQVTEEELSPQRDVSFGSATREHEDLHLQPAESHVGLIFPPVSSDHARACLSLIDCLIIISFSCSLVPVCREEAVLKQSQETEV
jgi:hypothetical protein